LFRFIHSINTTCTHCECCDPSGCPSFTVSWLEN